MSDVPFSLLKEFASELGWHGLCKSQHRLTADICGSLPVGTVITCYATTHLKFFLQINENPIGQSQTYQACLVPERYGLRHTEWVGFAIANRQSAISEAARLKPMLSRSILRNPVSRRQFLREHPHLVFRRFVGCRTYRRLTRQK